LGASSTLQVRFLADQVAVQAFLRLWVTCADMRLDVVGAGGWADIVEASELLLGDTGSRPHPEIFPTAEQDAASHCEVTG
jgi:hypothetical protein